MNGESTTNIPTKTPYHLLPVPDLNRALAYARSIDSLSRYKFLMFGYWAALWVIFNQLCPKKVANPFTPLVHLARTLKGGQL